VATAKNRCVVNSPAWPSVCTHPMHKCRLVRFFISTRGTLPPAAASVAAVDGGHAAAAAAAAVVVCPRNVACATGKASATDGVCGRQGWRHRRLAGG